MNKKHKPETIDKMRTSNVWKHINDCIEEYKKGLPVIEIANKHKVNSRTLNSALKASGVIMRKPGKRTSPIWNNIELYIQEYNSGLTTGDIAKKHSINVNTIKTCFRKMGVRMRKGGAQLGRNPWNKGKPYDAIRGHKNPRWKGGITNLNQQVRHCLKYKQWIKQVFERDNYTCVKCEDKRGGNLEADHYPIMFCELMQKYGIISKEHAENTSEFWDINNGRTLCLKCHNRTKQVRSRFKKFNSNKS
jgi:5-methylcytosine-specific restriction endonuclease McrA